jgi:sugar phosphate isomerase/epimerase
MTPFTLTACGDSISPWLVRQMAVLERAGLRYIEMRSVDNRPLVAHSLEEVRAIKLRLDARGFAVSALASPIGTLPVTAPFEPHLALFRHTLEVARLLEAPAIRAFSFSIPPGDNPDRWLDEVLARWRALIQAAAPYGIQLLHENGQGFYGDSALRCRRLLDALDCPAVRAVFNPAAFLQCGEQPYPAAYALLCGHIRYVHIKDACLTAGGVAPAGEEDGRLPDLLAALRQAGYRGFLSLEPCLAEVTVQGRRPADGRGGWPANGRVGSRTGSQTGSRTGAAEREVAFARAVRMLRGGDY